jgi:tetratricopeptide (TPR) repeat protein
MHLQKLLCALCVSEISVLSIPLLAAPTSQETIDSLRADLAMNFDNPNAHLALAKGLKQQNALTAFLICEHARTLFGDDAFHAAFDIVFRGGVTDVLFHARRQVLQEALKLQPRSVLPLRQMADLCSAHGDPSSAVMFLSRARLIAPDDFSLIQALQLNMTLAGNQADAQSLLNDWCTNHPDSPAAWEARAADALAQNGDSAGAVLDQAIAKYPQDGQLHLLRAKFDEDQKPADAQTEYLAAAQVAPDSSAAQAAAARYFLKVRHDPERALHYYLATYFLDPDFNDWESVDRRVRDEADEVSQARVAAAKASGEGIAGLLSDPNPLLQTAAMDQLQTGLGDKIAAKLLRLTTSDAPDVREDSIGLLVAHPEALAKAQMDEMMRSPDAWQRAAAAALLAGTQPETTLDQFAPALNDDSVLVRFTAASALIKRSQPTRSLVRQSTRSERNPWLRSTIADLLAQPAQ